VRVRDGTRAVRAPLRRLRLRAAASGSDRSRRSSLAAVANSLGVALSLSVFTTHAVSPYWFDVPSSSFDPPWRFRVRCRGSEDPVRAGDLEVFPRRPPHAAPEGTPCDSLSELSLLQSMTARSRPQSCCSVAEPPMRFRSPSAHEVRKVHSTGALPAPYGPPPGFLSLLAVCSLPDPAGLVSCRRRSWGFALQSLSLRAKP